MTQSYCYLSAGWFYAVVVPRLLVDADGVVLPAGQLPAVAHMGRLINLGDHSNT